jgi:hypothetical protein
MTWKIPKQGDILLEGLDKYSRFLNVALRKVNKATLIAISDVPLRCNINDFVQCLLVWVPQCNLYGHFNIFGSCEANHSAK